MKTLNPSALAAVVGVIDADAYAAGTYTTGWISMSDFQAIQAIVLAGDLGASATIDAKIEQATDASGTGAKDVTDAAITQLTKAGSDDNKQAIIDLWAEDLDLANDFAYARLSLTVSTAACDAGAVVMGHYARYQPASNNDLSTVAEIVTL
ncbi:hypothetical protein CEW89_08445 [Celeribacter ethanolicus]|uniref:Uncharacterized protein n=1 Tax=Celeribacter ethanolicus TaxID=1758178 RepID=A0A291GC45_9RHOB|nr:hypothetical protein [Celeribacter ethanolicus]ATG47602.1 hypothetical protein CEW89_08445 [Celeribacter ethanolicus]